MVQQRNSRLHPFAVLALVAITTVAVFSARAAVSSGAELGTPSAPLEGTPLSQATTDDVVFGLIEWGRDDRGYFVVEVQVRNEGELPVRLESQLVVLSVSATNAPIGYRELLRSTPSLPCSIEPGAQLAIRFAYDVLESETPVEISIGIIEVNRTGARVIFPLSPGAGASAIGGSGLSGNDAVGASATGSPSPTAPPSPGASPEAGGCQS